MKNSLDCDTLQHKVAPESQKGHACKISAALCQDNIAPPGAILSGLLQGQTATQPGATTSCMKDQSKSQQDLRHH